jgi:CheY-like chemotaxis protein
MVLRKTPIKLTVKLIESFFLVIIYLYKQFLWRLLVSESTANGSVIIVEDSAPTKNILTHLFQKNGFAVHGFKNGLEAYDYLKKNVPKDLKLILSDIMMPEMGGLELVQKLREEKIAQEIPIILASAMTDKDAILKAKELGVASFIVKPISAKKVIDVLKKMFPQVIFREMSST